MDGQRIVKGQPTAALRRVFFDARDVTDPEAPLTAADMDIGGTGAFTVKVSENGGAPATPSGSTVTEVDDTDMPGAFYVQLDAADIGTDGVLLVYVSSSGGPDNMIARCIPVQIYTNNDFTGLLEGSLTRDDAMRIVLRTAAAKFSKVGNDYVFRDLADSKDSHHGTVTTAGRIDADVDDPT